MEFLGKVNDYLLSKMICASHKLDNFIHKDERGGAEIVAIILVIGIVIAIAVIFKDRIMQFITDLMNSNLKVTDMTE